VRIMANGKLSGLIGRAEIAPSSKSGNYHKKAIPFDLDNPYDVDRIDAICALFNNPWMSGREYSRSHLAADVGDFCKKVLAGELEVITAAEYAKLVAPVRAQLEAAEKQAAAKKTVAAIQASNMTYAEMSNGQLRAVLKARGMGTKGNKQALIKRLEDSDAPAEEPETAPEADLDADGEEVDES